MTSIRALIVGAALFAGSVASATAADLYRGGSIKDGYVAMPAVGPASWYVRGDIGYSNYDRPSMLEEGRFDLTNTSIDDQWSGGVGIGRYFGRSVRGDLTWDHRFETDARGTMSNMGGVDFPGQRTFGLKSDLFLANLYYDFNMGGRFAPYIGVGLGAVNNKTTSGSVPDNCICGFSNVSIAGASQWSVAGAFMTGFTVDLRDRLHLDAGYRLLYLGDAHTGVITGTRNGGGTATDGDPLVRDMWAQELRIGLRYDIR
ncbi:MAG: outer membrane beta-barrel protein [Hyphomicrobiaceae bacterium]